MPKSRIIKDVVEDKQSLEKSLMMLLVLAKDVKNQQLEDWVSNELTGYKDIDSVPEYRKTTGGNIRYTGINANMQVKKIPLPSGLIPSKYREIIHDVSICEGIKAVSDFAESDSAAYRERQAEGQGRITIDCCNNGLDDDE